jgi:hypothetical protein
VSARKLPFKKARCYVLSRPKSIFLIRASAASDFQFSEPAM